MEHHTANRQPNVAACVPGGGAGVVPLPHILVQREASERARGFQHFIRRQLIKRDTNWSHCYIPEKILKSNQTLRCFKCTQQLIS